MQISTIFKSKRCRFLCISAILLPIGFILIFPLTNPWVIFSKDRITGVAWVYRGLSFEDDRWEVVLRGVKSGESIWLRVAADLKPALDTHPGEEMIGAVSIALDKNPESALKLLVPVYGAQLICGEEMDGSPLTPDHAKARRLLLSQTEVAKSYSQSFKDCSQIVSAIYNRSRWGYKPPQQIHVGHSIH